MTDTYERLWAERDELRRELEATWKAGDAERDRRKAAERALEAERQHSARLERERDEARAQYTSCTGLLRRQVGARSAMQDQRDEAREALRRLVGALYQDDQPRRDAIRAAEALIAAWGVPAVNEK